MNTATWLIRREFWENRAIWLIPAVLGGILILGAGIVDLMSPPPQPLVLAQLHMSIWWGALMIILGGVYARVFRPRPYPWALILKGWI